MFIRETLRELRKMGKMNQEELAEKIGVARGTISAWENGNNTPTTENVMALAAVFGVNPACLFIDDDSIPKLHTVTNMTADMHPMIQDEGRDFIVVRGERIEAPAPIWVPVISSKVITACCGHGSAYADDLQWEVEDYFPVPDQIVRGYSWQGAGFAILTAEGNSMEPYIHDGDLVLFARGIDVGVGDICIFSLNNRLKIRGIAAMNGEYILRAHNREYQDEKLDMLSDNYFVVGKVLRVISTRKVPPVV